MKINKKILAITTSLIVLVAAIMVGRLLYMQQSDKNYGSLAESITKSGELKKKITGGLGMTNLARYVTSDYLKSYSKDVAYLKIAFESIDKNPLMAGAGAIKTTYDKHKKTFNEYLSSNENLVATIKLYLDLWISCGVMGGNLDSIQASGSSLKLADYTTNAKECNDALAASEAAKDQPFNAQLFDSLRKNIGLLVTAYQKEFSASNKVEQRAARADIEKIWSNILSLNSVALDLKRSPDPSTAIDDLLKVTNEQKSNFFR